MSTVTKTVEVEVHTYEGEYNRAMDCASSMLDLLIDRGVVMHLSPFNRCQVLEGSVDIRSVLA